MNQSITCSCGAVFSRREGAEGHIRNHHSDPDAHTIIEDAPARATAEDRQPIPLPIPWPTFDGPDGEIAAHVAAAKAAHVAAGSDQRLELATAELIAARIENLRGAAAMEDASAALEVARGRFEAARGRLENADREIEKILRTIIFANEP